MVQAAVNRLWKEEWSGNLEKVVVRLKDESLEEVDYRKAMTRDKMQLKNIPSGRNPLLLVAADL